MEGISHAHIVSLKYRLKTNARDTDDSSIGFDRGRGRRQRELTKNKNQKRKYHVTIMLKEVCDFAEHQEEATYGLGYNLTLKRNSDKSVLKKDNAINDGKIKMNAIEWYVPHYTLSFPQQDIISKHILSKLPTEIKYMEKSAFINEVKTQKFITFEYGTQERINVPIWIIVGCQQRTRQDSQNLNNDNFYRPSVTSAQCVIGTDKYPDTGIFVTYESGVSIFSKRSCWDLWLCLGVNEYISRYELG